MSKSSRKYLKLFTKFIENLRIDSKEASAESSELGSELNLWESQQRALDFIGNGLDDGIHIFVILKSRQLGISTVTLAILLFWLAIHPRIFGALVIDNDENSQSFRDILTRYMDSFPAGYFGQSFTITKNNAKFLQFSNGSRLDFLVAGKSKTTWGESRAYTIALLSEVSKYGKAEGLNSFLETLSYDNPDRLYIMESTAHGINHFKHMWEEAGTDIHVKRRLFAGWWSKELNRIQSKDARFQQFGTAAPSPSEQEKIDAVWKQYQWKITTEQLAWYRWRESQKSVSRDMLNESQPWTEDDAFVLSGMSFFQTRKVTEDIETAIERGRNGQGALWYRYYLGNSFLTSTKEQILDQDRRHEVELRVWEMPVPEGRYVIGVDPAYGRNDNADNFVISIWRCFANKLVQAAEYASHDHSAQQGAWVLADLAGRYRNCIVNLEINGPGDQVMNEMNTLRRQLRAEEFNAAQGITGVDMSMLDSMRWYLYHRPDSMGAGYMYNWQTSFRTKFPLINGFRDSHVTDMLLINSVPLLREMYDVTQEGREIGAMGHGLHDDRVFSAALADEAWKSWVRTPMMQQNLSYEREMGLEDPFKARVSDLLNASIRYALTRPDPEPAQNTFYSERGFMPQ